MLRGENERNAKRKMKDLSVYMENLLDLSDHITQSYEMNTFLDFDSFLQNKANKAASSSREKYTALTPTHLASNIHESVASTSGLQSQQPTASTSLSGLQSQPLCRVASTSDLQSKPPTASTSGLQSQQPTTSTTVPAVSPSTSGVPSTTVPAAPNK